MRIPLLSLVLFGLILQSAFADQPGKAGKDGVVRGIEFEQPSLRRGFGEVTVVSKPTKITSAQELSKITKPNQVDFDKEYVLSFQWAGCIDDKLSFEVEANKKGPVVVFSYVAGKDIKRQALYHRLFVIPKDTNWRIERPGQRESETDEVFDYEIAKLREKVANIEYALVIKDMGADMMARLKAERSILLDQAGILGSVRATTDTALRLQHAHAILHRYDAINTFSLKYREGYESRKKPLENGEAKRLEEELAKVKEWQKKLAKPDKPNAAGLKGQANPQLPNEVKPVDGLWGKEEDGWQTQITVFRHRISTTDTSLPVIVWYKNGGTKPTVILSNAPAYQLHGHMKVLAPDGSNVVVFDCAKKHVMEEIRFEPGEIRGFWCDAFGGGCYKRQPGKLKPGTYTVRLGGSNEVKIQVQ